MRLVLVEPQLRHASGENNLGPIRTLIDEAALNLRADDVLLLPESFHFGDSRSAYLEDVRALARELGCHVVGGSHRELRSDAIVNSGVVVDPTGLELARYEKMRPYATEREWVSAGNTLGELEIGGCAVLVLICADFWFADLFQRATRLPDLVLVPALSVTRKSTPSYSRELWRHLSIARAYEFGAYVGISDWGHPSELPLLFTSGVAGFADPTRVDPAEFFAPVSPAAIRAYPIDLPALAAFRRDRVERGFFWKKA